MKKIDAFDTGGSFQTRVAHAPFDLFRHWRRRGSIDITEPGPKGSPTSSRVIKLSTRGLSASIKALRKRMCPTGVMRYFIRSAILAIAARAHSSSNCPPGAPLTPIAPMMVSPALMATPPTA